MSSGSRFLLGLQALTEPCGLLQCVGYGHWRFRSSPSCVHRDRWLQAILWISLTMGCGRLCQLVGHCWNHGKRCHQCPSCIWYAVLISKSFRLLTQIRYCQPARLTRSHKHLPQDSKSNPVGVGVVEPCLSHGLVSSQNWCPSRIQHLRTCSICSTRLDAIFGIPATAGPYYSSSFSTVNAASFVSLLRSRTR